MLVFFWNAPALTLQAGFGSYSLNGQSVNWVITPLSPGYGSFTFTGQAVTFRIGSTMLVRNAAAYSILVTTPTSNTILLDTPEQLDR